MPRYSPIPNFLCPATETAVVRTITISLVMMQCRNEVQIHQLNNKNWMCYVLRYNVIFFSLGITFNSHDFQRETGYVVTYVFSSKATL